MPEGDPAPVMEEAAVANGAATTVAAAAKKDNTKKEKTTKSKDVAVANKNAEEQNKGSENGTKGPSDGDVKMAEAEDAKEGDAGGVKLVGTEDVKMGGVGDADAKQDNNAKAAEGKDVKMAEAEAGNAEVKDEGQKEDKDENMNMDKEQLSAAEKQGEEEAEEKGSADKKEEGGDKKANANEEKLEKDGAKKQEKDGEATEEQVSESDKNVEENKDETPKSKKARSARDRSQGKDKKQDGSKSREAKSLLNTPSPYGTDRPHRERKIVERLVEVIEKESNRDFVVEKGRGTPLKDIPSVAHRISRKKPADLKFFHNILFGRKGKTVDFKGHILQFSGFVWHESDEKQRAKAKEKLDKCMKDILLDLCWLLAIPVPKTNVRKEDIVAKLLDFIAEPHAITDSGLSDDQGSNSGKRKRGGGSASKTPDGTPKRSKKKFTDDVTPNKRHKKALAYDTDEDEEDEGQPMKSDSEEDKDEDVDEAADEQEYAYDSVKEKASKKSSEVKDSAGKKKAATGSTHKTGPLRTTSKSPGKISTEKESPDDSAKVFSRKKKPVTQKRTPSSEKEIKEKKSSGGKVAKGKGESAEAGLPSKDELRKTIIEILKRVDFNTATFSDILKKLDEHYKIDLTPRKAAIKLMIQEELTKLSEEADEDEDGNEDAEKQPQRQSKEVVA